MATLRPASPNAQDRIETAAALRKRLPSGPSCRGAPDTVPGVRGSLSFPFADFQTPLTILRKRVAEREQPEAGSRGEAKVLTKAAIRHRVASLEAAPPATVVALRIPQADLALARKQAERRMNRSAS